MALSLLTPSFEPISKSELEGVIDVSYWGGFYYILRQTANPIIFNVLKIQDFDKSSIVLSFSLVIEKAKSLESFLVMQDSSGQLRYFISGNIDKNIWIG